MKIMRIRILVWLFVISLIMPGILSAKNLALELDGSTAIEVPNSDSINPKKAITIEAWMNMEKPVGECVAKDWGGQRDYIFPEIIQNGAGLRFVLWPGTKILDVQGLKLNEWQHVAGVWDGKEMRTYIDGKKMGSTPYDAPELAATGASLYIGVGDSKNWFCQGLIDEIRIWEVARTEAEINEFMMKTLNGDEDGLNAQYSFDEGDARDSTPNKNDGDDGFGKPVYVDVTNQLKLEPLSVDVKDKLTITWAWLKRTR